MASSRRGDLRVCSKSQRYVASEMFRSHRRRISLLIILATTLAAGHLKSATAPEPGDLRGVGKVTFPITCAPTISNAGSDATIEGPAIPSFTAPTDVQSDFARGVALLHSFFYEEARRVFTSVAERDPKCAMAQWGIAMTWWHPIWTPPTPDEMRAKRPSKKRWR